MLFLIGARIEEGSYGKWGRRGQQTDFKQPRRLPLEMYSGMAKVLVSAILESLCPHGDEKVSYR